MRGFVNKYTLTWYWVSKSQPCREQSTIAGLIAGWCGHVTRDTCVWCVTLRRRARQCWGRRSVYGSYKNWRWRSGDGISKSDWGYHSVQAQHGPSRHAGHVWWYCTQRRPLYQVRNYCEWVLIQVTWCWVFTNKRLWGTSQQNHHFLQVLYNIVKYCQTYLACLAKTKYKMRTRICGAAAGKCEDWRWC